MCGIAGLIGKHSDQMDELRSERAGEVQKHRGPNHQAIKRYELKAHSSVSLLHQRLSIIDLSDSANQPFEDDEFALVFNGEIYNYVELKIELVAQGCAFKTDSDTEVLFNALKTWGLQKTLKLCNGMWAFAWLEKLSNTVSLARDRFGVKPLYFTNDGETVAFASEIKAVLELTTSKLTLNRDTVFRYLESAVLEADVSATFFNEVSKLPPASFAIIRLDQSPRSVEIQRFYDVETSTRPFSGSFAEGQAELQKQVRRSLEIRLRADVPVGVLLSGGLDSSILAALSKELNTKPTEFLSYVSDDARFDESVHIDSMAKHLGSKVTKVRIDFDADDPVSGLERATWQNDQPLHSLSAYAHLLLMEEARNQGITVLLSGQGADESFCGYRKYWPFYFQSLARRRKFGTLAFEGIKLAQNPDFFGNLTFSEMKRYLPRRLQIGRAQHALLHASQSRLALGLMKGESLSQRQVRDIIQLSVPSLLHYEDRMSMAMAREIRLPFLDFNVVEFGLSLPDEFKLKNGWTKFLLRKTFEKHLPPSIAWRKDKKGFTNPQAVWIRSKLKDDILTRLSGNAQIYNRGLVDRDAFLRLYGDVLNNVPRSDDRLVFRVYALEIFLNVFGSRIRD